MCGRLDNATNTGMYRSPFSTSPSSPLLLLSPCPIIVGGDERRVSSVEQPCHDIDEMIDWLGTSGGLEGNEAARWKNIGEAMVSFIWVTVSPIRSFVREDSGKGFSSS